MNSARTIMYLAAILAIGVGVVLCLCSCTFTTDGTSHTFSVDGESVARAVVVYATK